jgi:hypothetical protein
VASDALLDSAGRLFWPIILLRLEFESRHPSSAPRRSFCTILLLSTLPSHIIISNAISRVVRREYVRARLTDRPTNRPTDRTSLLLLLLLLLLLPHRTTTTLLPATPATLSPPSLSSISYPASTSTHHVISGWLTVDHHSHRHIDLIRFSDQTFSLFDYFGSKPATDPKHTIVTATC